MRPLAVSVAHRATFCAAFSLSGGLACVEGPGSATPLVEADYDAFVSRVQPVYEDQCTERNCHGNEGRPLALFATGKHRLAPTQVDSDEPLDEAELRANFDRSRAFLLGVEHARSCELVSKPLAVGAGGVGHAAGAVFDSDIDDQYLDLLDWVSDALEGSAA